MPTKTIEKAKDVTRQAETALANHVKPAAAKLEQEAAAQGYGSTGLLAATEHALYRLTDRMEAYEAAETAVVREGVEDTRAREERDKRCTKLRGTLSSLASSVETSYGRPAAAGLKLTGRTPVVPSDLVAKAHGFLAASDGGFAHLPAPRESWRTVDLAAARQEVAAETDAVEKTLTGVDTDVRQTQRARAERDALAVKWHRALRFAVDLGRAVLNRADQPDLADRVLPSETQVSDSEPTVDEDAEAPAGSAAGGSGGGQTSAP